MTQQELEVIFAQRRADHEAKMRELQIQEAQIQKQRNILKAEFKAGNKALDALKNGTPETCLLNHRKRVGYVLRHNLGKQVREFESKYYDTAQAVTNFNIEENGTMTIHITIPAKQEQEAKELKNPCEGCIYEYPLGDKYGSSYCQKFSHNGDICSVHRGDEQPCGGRSYKTSISDPQS